MQPNGIWSFTFERFVLKLRTEHGAVLSRSLAGQPLEDSSEMRLVRETSSKSYIDQRIVCLRDPAASKVDSQPANIFTDAAMMPLPKRVCEINGMHAYQTGNLRKREAF